MAAKPEVESEKTADQFVRDITDDIKARRKERESKSKVLIALVEAVWAFCQALSNIKLYPYQIEPAKRIIESLILNDGESITMLFSRQSGKTELISVVVVGCCVILPKLARIKALVKMFPALAYYENGLWVGIFAPVLDQSQTMFFRVRSKFHTSLAESILSHPEIADVVEQSNGAIARLSSGSLIECRSASPGANIESKTYHIAIVDEAQDVETNKLRKSISPMLASTNGTMVMSGTPNTVHSAFYEQIIQNKAHDKRNSKSSHNHFEYDYRVAASYNDRYARYVEKEKTRYGEDSDEFRMSYKLEWIFERGMFTSLILLQERVYNRKYDVDEWNKFRGWSCIGSIDFGKSTDSTVLTLGVVDWKQPVEDYSDAERQFYRCAIVKWVEIYGDDWDSQFRQLADTMRESTRLEKMVMDATGVGAGLVDRFKADFPYLEIIDLVYSTPEKSDGYKLLDQYLRKGLLWVPYGRYTRMTREFKEFESQMTTVEKNWRGQHMVVEAPKGIRGAHDDYPDSTMEFAVCAATPAMGSGFDSVDENIFGASNTDRNLFLRG